MISRSVRQLGEARRTAARESWRFIRDGRSLSLIVVGRAIVAGRNISIQRRLTTCRESIGVVVNREHTCCRLFFLLSRGRDSSSVRWATRRAEHLLSLSLLVSLKLPSPTDRRTFVWRMSGWKQRQPTFILRSLGRLSDDRSYYLLKTQPLNCHRRLLSTLD